MSNKQELPLRYQSGAPLKNQERSQKPPRSINNNPYLSYKPDLQNDYSKSYQFSPVEKKPSFNSPLLKDFHNKFISPVGNEFISPGANFVPSRNYTKLDENEDIHDSFKFSQFLTDRHSETLTQNEKNLSYEAKVFNSYDLQHNPSKYRSNTSPTTTNMSQLMQNKREEQNKFIAKVFETQLTFIKTLDESKYELYEMLKGDYSIVCSPLMSGFRSLDFNGFSRVFEQMGINADLDDLKLLFWRYNTEKVGIDFESFRKYFAPSNGRGMKNGQIIKGDLKEACVKVLKMNLNFEYSLEMVRKEIKAKSIGLREIFDEISLGEISINDEKLKQFMAKHNIFINEIDANSLYSLYDPNGLGLTFKAFYHEMLPKL